MKIKKLVKIEDDAAFIKRRNKLQEELKLQKNKLKEKRELLQKKEKQMIEQYEKYVSLEERCRRMQILITEHKAGIKPTIIEAHKTEEDVENIRKQLAEAQKGYNEEKEQHNLLVRQHQNKIKELRKKLESVNRELQVKVEESRSNYLKVNELKKYMRKIPNTVEKKFICIDKPEIVEDITTIEVVKEKIVKDEPPKESIVVENKVKVEEIAKNEEATRYLFIYVIVYSLNLTYCLEERRSN